MEPSTHVVLDHLGNKEGDSAGSWEGDRPPVGEVHQGVEYHAYKEPTRNKNQFTTKMQKCMFRIQLLNPDPHSFKTDL